MKVPVSITVNGRRYQRDVEPRLLLVHFIRDLGGYDRHQGRLRHQPVRRVHRAARRRRRQVVHLSRRPGRRRADHDHRRARAGRHAASAAGSLLEQARPAVRLLHAGHDPGRARAAASTIRSRSTKRSATGSKATCAAAPATRTSSARSAKRRRRWRGGDAMSTRIFGSGIRRREDPRLITGRGDLHRRSHAAGHAPRRDAAQPARARAHQEHRREPRAKTRPVSSRSTPARDIAAR